MKTRLLALLLLSPAQSFLELEREDNHLRLKLV